MKAGTPVVGGGGDQAAQAVGVGAVSPGIVALTLGKRVKDLVAVVNNFLLNRWWTFRSTGPAHLEFGKFLTVSLAGLGLNTVAFSFFRAHLELHVMLSQLLAIGCVLPFNFLLNKFWSFRHA